MLYIYKDIYHHIPPKCIKFHPGYAPRSSISCTRRCSWPWNLLPCPRASRATASDGCHWPRMVDEGYKTIYPPEVLVKNDEK